MLSEGSGCPNASLEAMARGIPVVANTDGGVGEQILSGINGFLVEGRDPREMARQIRYLLVNQEARRRFGEAARITATKDFSMDTMVRRYKRLLEDPAPRAQPVNNPARKRSHRHKASAAT